VHTFPEGNFQKACWSSFRVLVLPRQSLRWTALADLDSRFMFRFADCMQVVRSADAYAQVRSAARPGDLASIFRSNSLLLATQGAQRLPLYRQHWLTDPRLHRHSCKVCLLAACWLSLPRAALLAYLPRAMGLQRRWSLQTWLIDFPEDIDHIQLFIVYVNGYLHLSSALHASQHDANKK